MMQRFWDWYEKHYQINLIVSSGLFFLQIFHLYWMATYIIANIAFGRSFFAFPSEFSWIYALVDYTEIPALISVGLLYVNDLRKGKKNRLKTWLYLAFLNIQWVHLFWITDEVVAVNFVGKAPVHIPLFLAYAAIAIDFLELPVMVETVGNAVRTVLRLQKD